MINTVAERVNRVVIREITKNNKPYIQFDFTGYLDHPEAMKGIEAWRALMKDTGRKDLIYNCKDMTGFDSTARQLWQAMMKEYKPRIGNIWMISDNRFILAAAKTMGVLSGFSIKTARSLDDIKN